jgi:hypothetical protein
MKRSIRLSPVVSLDALIGNQGAIVAFDIGPDGVIYFVVALKPLDDRIERNQVSFAKTLADSPQRYRVLGLDGSDVVHDCTIENERFNIHHVQPLLGELLLVCARCHYKGPSNTERNGRVYSRDGKLTREFVLGDGIASVQTTSRGEIWTSYFDEGIFGNYGWNDPIGASGLVAWDPFGTQAYSFVPGKGLDHICDCYALNVATDDDVWLYYYTEFPLVRLRRRAIEAVWSMPVGGSHAFALLGKHVLFAGGFKDRDTYRLFSLGTEAAPVSQGEFELFDHEGQKLVPDRVVARAEAVYLISRGDIYRLDVQTAVSALVK